MTIGLNADKTQRPNNIRQFLKLLLLNNIAVIELQMDDNTEDVWTYGDITKLQEPCPDRNDQSRKQSCTVVSANDNDSEGYCGYGYLSKDNNSL